METVREFHAVTKLPGFEISTILVEKGRDVSTVIFSDNPEDMCGQENHEVERNTVSTAASCVRQHNAAVRAVKRMTYAFLSPVRWISFFQDLFREVDRSDVVAACQAYVWVSGTKQLSKTLKNWLQAQGVWDEAPEKPMSYFAQEVYEYLLKHEEDLQQMYDDKKWILYCRLTALPPKEE